MGSLYNRNNEVHPITRGISDNRMKHMRTVARVMYCMALADGLSERKARELFMLGFIHDIGYEFCTEKKEHTVKGYEMASSVGFKYAYEIGLHGIDADNTDELRRLNMADLMVDSNGDFVGIEKRLRDIETRYGSTSHNYIKAVEIAEKLGLVEIVNNNLIYHEVELKGESFEEL